MTQLHALPRFGRTRLPLWLTAALVLTLSSNAYAASAPTLTFTGSKTVNGVFTVNWSTTNAKTCDASAGWTGAKPTSGTAKVGPFTAGAWVASVADLLGRWRQSRKDGRRDRDSLAVRYAERGTDERRIRGFITAVLDVDEFDDVYGCRRLERHEGAERQPKHGRAYRDDDLPADLLGKPVARRPHPGPSPSPAGTSPHPDVIRVAHVGDIGRHLEADVGRDATRRLAPHPAAWTGTKATRGSQTTSALTTNSSYTLACTGAGGVSAVPLPYGHVSEPQVRQPLRSPHRRPASSPVRHRN